MDRLLLPLLAASLLLGACSTPAPALQQANHTAALAAQLEVELKEFARIQDASGRARLRSIAEQESAIQFVAGQAAIREAARTANNDLGPARLQGRIMSVASAIVEADEQNNAEAARLQAELAKLLKPLPSTAEKMTAAQKALAELGTELDARTRFAELKDFVDEVRKSVKDNRQKIEEAEKEAATAAR
jgi:hypothetical protein